MDVCNTCYNIILNTLHEDVYNVSIVRVCLFTQQNLLMIHNIYPPL